LKELRILQFQRALYRVAAINPEFYIHL
jgi:hypothetical protein